jgi:hypothetical protein
VRNFLILVLAGVCVWLLIERNDLKTQVTLLGEQVTKLQSEAAANTAPAPNGRPQAAGQRPPASGAPRRNAPTGNWLDEHLDKSAKALENPASKNDNRR